MIPEIVEYDGYLTFVPLSNDQLKALDDLNKSSGQFIDYETGWLEFKYSGRDTNRKIVRLLSKLAEIIQEADGEITCTIQIEEGDPIFEFFSIKKGRLFRQIGRIMRGTVEAIPHDYE